MYVGGFRDGKLHGYGKYHYHPSNDEYEGEWVADMKHGHGMYRYEGGDKYEGEWRCGKKHGKGSYNFATGDEYIGSWKDDKIHGHGQFSIARNGNKYEGAWEDSYRHGFGILKSGNGDLYEGNWAKGKEEGLGVLTYVNGNRYCGDWRAGQMDGKGVLVEGGQKFTVEHIAAYLVSKVPVEMEGTVDPDWNRVNQHFLAYLAKMSPSRGGGGTTGGADGGGGGAGDAAAGSGATGGAGTGAADVVNSEQYQKMKEERDSYERRYKQLLQQKSASHDDVADDDITKDRDVASLQRKALDLKEQRDLEKRRADEAVSKERVLSAELEEIRYAHKQLSEQVTILSKGAAAGTAGTGSPETDRLQRRVYELEKELAARKQTANTSAPGGGATTGNETPAEMRARLELLEGEVRMLKNTREELQKSREQNLDAQRSIMQLEGKNDELMKEVNIQRQRAGHLQQQLSDTSNRSSDERSNEVRDLHQEVQQLKAAALTQEEQSGKLKAKLKDAEQKARGATDMEQQLNSLKASNKTMQTKLDKQTEDLEKVKAQNADLSRQLEEVDGDAPQATTTKASKKAAKSAAADAEASSSAPPGAASGGGGEAAELLAKIDALQGDIKKEKKKHKKASGERDALEQALAQSALDVQRATRALAMYADGKVLALAKIRPFTPAEQQRGDSVVVAVGPSGSELLVGEEGRQHSHVMDVCFGEDAAPAAVFEEAKRLVRGVAEGYAASLITFGPIGSGKSQLLSQVLPMALQEVFRACDAAAAASQLSFTFSCSCLEFCSEGVFDFNNSGTTGSDLQFVKDGFGSVVAEGAITAPCTTARDAVKLFTACGMRRRKRRSHLVFTLHATGTHKVSHAAFKGRLIVADLAGSGPLGEQSDDVESAKYVNQSIMAVGKVIDALHAASTTGQPDAAVPYRAEALTMALSDALGGNCHTAVLGVVSPSGYFQEETAHALATLAKASGIQNVGAGRCFETRDVLHLRELVSQLQSPEAARPSYVEIASLRD